MAEIEIGIMDRQCTGQRIASCGRLDEDGEEYIWYDPNLLEISEVTLFYKKGKATATFK